MNKPGLDEQISEVKREISLREALYPRWVNSGKLTQIKADRQIALMQAVLATLLEVQQSRKLL